MKKHRFRILFAALAGLVIIAAVLFFYFYNAAKPRVTQTVVEASCTEPGYIVTNDLKTGTSTVQNFPARGHDFSDWVPDEGAGTQSRTCGACGFSESIRISSDRVEALPRLCLTGSMDGIGKKVKVTLDAEFTGMGEDFKCSAVMTLQGHSTYGYPKHNYTVRFYDDAASEQKHRLRFKNWNDEHKYILKANYVDLSQCRNLVGARVWAAMAARRNNLPARVAALPTYGAVDGFPVEVYLNGEFLGLYTMNLHKDDDLYGMEDGERVAMLICNRHTADEALFRAKAAFLPDYTSDWEIEFCGTGDDSWAAESFNKLIDFVMNSSDEEFRNRLPEYMDVDAAIDYLIFIHSLGLRNSGAKDLVMLNYGDVWIPSAYDMDEAFGLDTASASYLAPEEFLPEKTGGGWDSGTGSLLWDRLLNAYEEEIRARYSFLRENVLSEENVTGLVEEFTGSIPGASYDMDMNLYTGRPVDDPDMTAQITDYISRRFAVLDSILEVDNK